MISERMNMTKRQRVLALLVVMLLAALVAFGALRYQNSRQPQKVIHSSDLNDLRASFNRDKGKVRMLLLLSPT